MYCSKCSKEISDSSRFCKFCGNENRQTITTSQLEELYNLKTKGIITEEEFESKKRQFLNNR